MKVTHGDDRSCSFCGRRITVLCHDGGHGIEAENARGEPDRGLPLALAHVERQMILAAVAANPGHLERAALALGISRTTLWRRLRDYARDARRDSVQGGELDA